MSINVINQKVLLKQIQNDLSKILNEFIAEDNGGDTREAMAARVCDLFGDRIPETFDKDKFQVKIDIVENALDITPLNFVSALWLQGMMVSDKEIQGDMHETAIAVYQWENEKMVVTPKSRADLF